MTAYDSNDAEKWSEVGKLKGPRYGHAVIELHGQFMIIGGRTLKSSTMKSEICSFTGSVLRVFFIFYQLIVIILRTFRKMVQWYASTIPQTKQYSPIT